MQRRNRARARVLPVVICLAIVAAACGSRETIVGANGQTGALQPGAAGSPAVNPSSDGLGGTADDLGGAGDTTSGAASSGPVADSGVGSGGVGSGGGGTSAGAQPGSGSAAGAGGARPGATGKTDPGVTDTAILLGNTTSQSGVMAGQFDGTPNAAYAYLRAINEKGGWRGRKFQMKIYDDGLDGTRNLAQTKKLVEEDKVFALLANATPVQDASSGYLKGKNIPVIGTIPAVSGCTDPNVVPCTLSPSLWSGHAEYTLGPRGMKVGSKAALIWIAQQISRDQAQGVRAALKKWGWQVVTEYEAGLVEPDFTSFVLQARNAGADFVYSVMEISGNSRLARAMDRQGFRVPFFGLVNYDDRFLDLGPAASFGYGQGPGPVLFSDNHPKMNEFRSTYAKYYPNQKIGGFTFFGWEFGRLFVEQGLNRLGPDITRQALLDALYQTRNWTGDGVFDPLSVLPKGQGGENPPRCGSIVRVQGGKFVHVSKESCAPELTRYR